MHFQVNYFIWSFFLENFGLAGWRKEGCWGPTCREATQARQKLWRLGWGKLSSVFALGPTRVNLLHYSFVHLLIPLSVSQSIHPSIIHVYIYLYICIFIYSISNLYHTICTYMRSFIMGDFMGFWPSYVKSVLYQVNTFIYYLLI